MEAVRESIGNVGDAIRGEGWRARAQERRTNLPKLQAPACGNNATEKSGESTGKMEREIDLFRFDLRRNRLDVRTELVLSFPHAFALTLALRGGRIFAVDFGPFAVARGHR